MDKEVEEVNYFYDNNYFRINKLLQVYAGLWPYESRLNKLIPKLILNIYLFIAVLPLFNGIFIWCGVNIATCGENILGVIYAITIITKYWVTYFSEDKLRKIYLQVAKNWLEISDPDEHAILIKYAREGKINTMAYIGFLILAAICFCHIPWLPILLDYIIPLNESRSITPFVKAEYTFDPIEHFFKLYLFFMCGTVITILSTTSIDTTYSVLVHQILGMLSIVKYRLQLATLSFDPQKDLPYEMIIKSIYMHKEALHFIAIMETSYRLFFLMIIVPTAIFISTGVVIAIEHNVIFDLLRHMLIVIGVMLHFLYLSWPGQRVTDLNDELFLSIYENEWYNISEKSKRLLKIIMLRTIKPCTFTAGGLYIMNLENFGAIMRSAISYFAVISSFR